MQDNVGQPDNAKVIANQEMLSTKIQLIKSYDERIVDSIDTKADMEREIFKSSEFEKSVSKLQDNEAMSDGTVPYPFQNSNLQNSNVSVRPRLPRQEIFFILKPILIVRHFARVAFGTTASQFLLAVSIHKHLLTYENVEQNFLEKFLANLYVDDNINGDDSFEKAFELYKKRVACMKDAGFEFRKFHTNNPYLHTTINKIEKLQPLEDNLKVLGIDWHKQNDNFIIDLNKIYEAGFELPMTKRNILKIIASIYDPIGIISSVLALFKILFQL